MLRQKTLLKISLLALFFSFPSFSFSKKISAHNFQITPMPTQKLKTPDKTDWTFIVYMAADNDLDYFARRNLEEMKLVGSNERIAIVVQLDRHGAHEHTKRLYMTKEAIYWMNSDDITANQKLNSGSSQTLIDCCEWAIQNYPAKHYALILWNHGIGILDSIRSKTTNASELFVFNPANHMLELDRSIGFIDYLKTREQTQDSRGVCFSDTYGSYLTNEKLNYALKEISTKLLKGKKLDIIAFDACLMAMLEVGHLVAPYAKIMVASQEVELGTGWPYHTILEPFEEKTLTPLEFATHMVTSYAENYSDITKDFTQSALNLELIPQLEKNITLVADLLLEALTHQESYSVKRAIRASRSKRICTYFSEPTYVDLHNFYSNLLQTTEFIELQKDKMPLVQKLEQALREGKTLIEKSVLINCVGENLEKAMGVSIYFPLRYVDLSYTRIPFAKKSSWLSFLNFIL